MKEQEPVATVFYEGRVETGPMVEANIFEAVLEKRHAKLRNDEVWQEFMSYVRTMSRFCQSRQAQRGAADNDE